MQRNAKVWFGFVWTSLYFRRQEGVPGCDRNRTGCLAPCLGVWEQKLYSGEPRVAGTCSLWEGVSELLGRPVDELYSSIHLPFGKGAKEN